MIFCKYKVCWIGNFGFPLNFNKTLNAPVFHVCHLQHMWPMYLENSFHSSRGFGINSTALTLPPSRGQVRMQDLKTKRYIWRASLENPTMIQIAWQLWQCSSNFQQHICYRSEIILDSFIPNSQSMDFNSKLVFITLVYHYFMFLNT